VRTLTSISLEQISGYNQTNRNFFEQQGSGMGLIIVKNLMNIFNSRFEINSNDSFVEFILDFDIV
jgi:signal transduction histidine kinase